MGDVVESLRTRADWWGARTVNRMPFLGEEIEDERDDGGLGQPHALGLATEWCSKSAMPQRICVRRSRRMASGMMMWL